MQMRCWAIIRIRKSCDAAGPQFVGCRSCSTGTYVPLRAAPKRKRIFVSYDCSAVLQERFVSPFANANVQMHRRKKIRIRKPCDAAGTQLVGCRFCSTGAYVPLRAAPERKRVFVSYLFSVVPNNLVLAAQQIRNYYVYIVEVVTGKTVSIKRIMKFRCIIG